MHAAGLDAQLRALRRCKFTDIAAVCALYRTFLNFGPIRQN